MDGTHRRDDAELVAAVLAGDREAFGPLLARWQASVLRLCRRLLGSGPQAEDVAQEAAVQAFVGLPRLADPSRFGAWLLAIAANLARMALRRRHLLALDGLPADAAGLRGGTLGPTPEDAWANREVHQAIVAALRELPPATREAVIGFYLQGYSYQELAELLDIPLSTVRGRLYHGRRRLRRELRPLAEQVLTPDPTRRKEQRLDSTALVAEVALVGRLAFSTDCLVTLQERGGPRQLALEPVDAITGDVVERLLGGEQPLAPTTHDLVHRLVAELGGRVAQVTIRRLVGQAVYADVTLDRSGERREVEARPGDAVALALLADAPIRVLATVMDAAGFDPGDRQQQRVREQRDLERLRRRVAERAGPPPPSPIAPPPPLASHVRQQVEDCLERLRAELSGWLALLTHDSGTLVAWAGPGDPAAMERYCQARAARDADLTHLLMRDVFPPHAVEAVVYHTVGQLWRIETGIVADEPQQECERLAQSSAPAVRELETLLQVGTSVTRPARPDDRPDHHAG
jgi:RNA polymerase sigma factor (sigma-70 family)